MRVREFFVLIKSRILVLVLKGILIVIRIFRNVRFVIKSLLPVLCIIPFWIAFIVILSRIGSKDILFYLNEAKYSIFTSVVLVGATSTASAINRKRKNLTGQYNLYMDLNFCAVEYARQLMNLTNQSFDGDYFYLFHTKETFEKLENTICNASADFSNSTHELQYQIEIVDRVLNLISATINKDEMLFIDKNTNSCLASREALLKIKHSVDSKNIDVEDIRISLQYLYNLIEEIRYPWRRDSKIDRFIDNLIA